MSIVYQPSLQRHHNFIPVFRNILLCYFLRLCVDNSSPLPPFSLTSLLTSVFTRAINVSKKELKAAKQSHISYVALLLLGCEPGIPLEIPTVNMESLDVSVLRVESNQVNKYINNSSHICILRYV